MKTNVANHHALVDIEITNVGLFVTNSMVANHYVAGGVVVAQWLGRRTSV